MKINLPKLQSGGGMPPFNYYTPVMVPDTSAAAGTAASVKKSSDSGGLDEKDLFEMIADIDGLPSDTQALINRFQSIYSRPNLFGSTGTVDTSSLATMYLQGLQQMKVANFNKAQYDKVQQHVIQQGGLNELAVTGDGRVIVNSDEGIKQVDVFEYIKNKDKYAGVSNAELLRLRAYSSPFDNSLLQVVGNGIGMDQINKLIKESVASLGTSTYAEEGYSKHEKGQITAGIKFLQEAYAKGAKLDGMGLEGVYKSKILTKEQTQQAQLALEYVYNMLPGNAKTLLAARTGGVEQSKNLIAQYIGAGMKPELQFTTTLELDAEGKKPGSKTQASEDALDKIKNNTAMQFVLGYGQTNDFPIMNGTTDGIRVKSNSLPINKPNGDPVGNNSTVNEITTSQYAGIFDMQNVSMGGEFINESGLQKVLFDGNVHGMDLPIDVDEYMQTGKIKPDFELLQTKELADQEIRNRKIPANDFAAMNEVYAEFGLPIKYNNNGTLNSEKWGRFGAFQATAVSTAFNENPGFAYGMQEITDSNEKDNLTQIFKNKMQNFEFDDKGFLDSLSFGLSSWDSYYKGIVFIPVKTNAFNALAGSGEKLTKGQATNLESVQQQAERVKGYNNPGSFNL